MSLGARLINLCCVRGDTWLVHCGLLYSCLLEVGTWKTLRWQGGRGPVHAGLRHESRDDGGLHRQLKH